MEENKKTFSKKRRSPHSNRKGGAKKGKWRNATREPSAKKSHAPETVYRVLCQSIRTGSVIGKGGGRVKALRAETQAKIAVADSVPGSDERVITISSPSTQVARKSNAGNDDEDLKARNDDNAMEPLCSAQDALMKVHERIIEEDIDGAENDDKNEVVVTARLLVPNNTVGCLLGRKGDVIQKLRKETGANIRVLPGENLPRCALDTDELVQISGKPALVKKALYEVSTLLHQNPRKDEPPQGFPLAYGTRNSHPAGPPVANISPPGKAPWLPHSRNEYSMPKPWTGGFGNQQAGVQPGDFDGFPLPIGGESPREFSMKLLCSAGRIGGLLGKGGFILRELQQETGARIHVEDNSPESNERVICVSSIEALRNSRSQTIDTILHLQNIISEHGEKGTITTRLLVPSSKVGCILGQGGHVINEMRRRTQADIRVFSKEDKPKCASSGEELLQISGKFAVAKDALVEVALRLRTRILRDADAKGEPAPFRPEPVTRNFPARGSSPSGAIGAGSSGRYEEYDFRRNEDYEVGIRKYQPPSYPTPPSAMSYSNHISSDMRISSNTAGPIHGAGGVIREVIYESRMRPLDHHPPGGSERLRGSSEHYNLGHSTFQEYGALPGQMNPQRDPYQNYNAEPSSYQNINVSENPYQSYIAEPSSYQNINVSENPYQSFNIPQAPPPHQNINSEQAQYHNPSVQGSYHY